MTNNDLGDLLGVGPSMASRLRSGHRLPSAKVMDQIAKHFDVTLEQLHCARRAGAREFGRLLRGLRRR